jgi:ribose/xylose/arabinose/galactoside ABC-type transport system permease subunit
MNAPTLTRPEGSPTGSADRPPARLDTLRSYSTLLGMIVVVVGIAVARPLFVDPRNLAAVAVDATVLVVLAVGLSVLMSMKGLDLSIAATADLAGYLAARALLDGLGTPAAVLIALAVGLTVGVAAGVLSGYLGVPAIIATLGLNLVLTAIGLVVSDNGTPQQLFTAPIDLVRPVLVFGSDSWGPFRLLLIAAVVVVVVTWFATTRTTWGRRIELVNAGARAAVLAGTPVRATFASGFVLCGLLAGVGGLMLTARTGLAVPGSAQPFLLDAFTAVYLGATASPRGRISVLWTVLGAVFVTLLANGLVLLGLGAPWRYGLNGALILLALALGVLRRRATR